MNKTILFMILVLYVLYVKLNLIWVGNVTKSITATRVVDRDKVCCFASFGVIRTFIKPDKLDTQFVTIYVSLYLYMPHIRRYYA